MVFFFRKEHTWKDEGFSNLQDVMETETQSNIEKNLVGKLSVQFISELLLRFCDTL